MAIAPGVRRERIAEARYDRGLKRKSTRTGLVPLQFYLTEEQTDDLELFLYLESCPLSEKVRELVCKWMLEKQKECEDFRRDLIGRYEQNATH